MCSCRCASWSSSSGAGSPGSDSAAPTGEDARFLIEYTPKAVFGAPGGPPGPERAIVAVNTRLGYVTYAGWPGRSEPLEGPPAVNVSQAQSAAASFASSHCPFWAEGMELTRSTAIPASREEIRQFVWEKHTETTWLKVLASVCMANGEVIQYRCLYVPDLKQPSITEDEAKRLGEEYWAERGGGVEVSLKEAVLNPAAYEAPGQGPAWALVYTIAPSDGIAWSDALTLDALTGEVLSEPAR